MSEIKIRQTNVTPSEIKESSQSNSLSEVQENIDSEKSTVEKEEVLDSVVETNTETQSDESKETLKAPSVVQQDVKEVDPYKLLGVEGDENFKKLVDAYKGNKLGEYLAISTQDYDKFTTEDLFRLDMQKRYPGLNPEKINALVEEKLSKEYGFDEDENSPSNIRKQFDANKIREELKKAQADYEIPKYEPKSENTVDPATVQQFTEYYEKNDVVKAFETNKIIQLGNGEDALNFEATDIDLKAATFDPNHFYKFMYNDDGTFNMSKWLKIVNYGKNMDAVEKALIDRGKSLGKKSVVSDLEDVPATIAEAAANKKDGVVIKGYR